MELEFTDEQEDLRASVRAVLERECPMTGADPYVLDGTTASELAVVATVDDGDGTGLFVVDANDVATTPVNAYDASRPLARVEFDAVAVHPERVLGQPGAVEQARVRAR